MKRIIIYIKKLFDKDNMDMEDEYKFNISVEMAIYKDVCGKRLKREEKKLICDKNKCKSYNQWKDYVRKKYNCYRKKQLINFYRYLKQKSRNEGQMKKGSELFFPVMLTIFITETYTKIIETINQDEFKKLFESCEKNTWSMVMAFTLILLVLIAFIIVFVIILYMFIAEVLDSSKKKDFYEDYQEIIGEMIDELE